MSLMSSLTFIVNGAAHETDLLDSAMIVQTHFTRFYRLRREHTEGSVSSFMKWFAIIAVSLAVVLYGLNVLNPEEAKLEQREDELYYKVGAETAFTGDGLVYHPNGQKMQQGRINAGKPTGPWKQWHANGQLHWEGNYKEGKQDGEWVQYDEAGKQVEKFTYFDGVKQAPADPTSTQTPDKADSASAPEAKQEPKKE